MKKSKRMLGGVVWRTDCDSCGLRLTSVCVVVMRLKALISVYLPTRQLFFLYLIFFSFKI